MSSPTRSVVFILALTAAAIACSGCRRCDLFGGPDAAVRLEFEVDVDHALSRRPEASAEERDAVIDAAMEQSSEVVRRRLEELDVDLAKVDVRGRRLICHVPFRSGRDEDLIPTVKRTLARLGRLEFRIADDQERAFYDRLRPVLEQDGRVELVPEEQSFFLRAADRPQPDGKVLSGTDVIREVLELARAQGIAPPSNRELLFEDVTSHRGPGGPAWPVSPRAKVWRSYLLDREPSLTGESVADASLAFEQGGPEAGRPFVSLRFNEQGRQRFGDVTAANVRKRLAIVVDGEVSSAPVIQEAIRGGQARITLGGFSDLESLVADGRALVVALRSGELPAPLTLVSETLIGPSGE